MCENFDKAVLKIVVAQICHSLGWQSLQRSTHDVLTDVLERYLKQISNTTVGYCHNYSRTIPNLTDVGLTFERLGIILPELEEYINQVEQGPLNQLLPQYPLPKKCLLKHAINGEKFARSEFYDDHLPPLVKVLQDEEKEERQEAEEVTNEKEVEDELAPKERPPTLTIDTTRPLKRLAESPPYSPIEPKRLNLDAQLLSPELTRPDLKVITPKELTPVKDIGILKTRDVENILIKANEKLNFEQKFTTVINEEKEKESEEKGIEKVIEKETENKKDKENDKENHKENDKAIDRDDDKDDYKDKDNDQYDNKDNDKEEEENHDQDIQERTEPPSKLMRLDLERPAEPVKHVTLVESPSKEEYRLESDISDHIEDYTESPVFLPVKIEPVVSPQIESKVDPMFDVKVELSKVSPTAFVRSPPVKQTPPAKIASPAFEDILTAIKNKAEKSKTVVDVPKIKIKKELKSPRKIKKPKNIAAKKIKLTPTKSKTSDSSSSEAVFSPPKSTVATTIPKLVLKTSMKKSTGNHSFNEKEGPMKFTIKQEQSGYSKIKVKDDTLKVKKPAGGKSKEDIIKSNKKKKLKKNLSIFEYSSDKELSDSKNTDMKEKPKKKIKVKFSQKDTLKTQLVSPLILKPPPQITSPMSESLSSPEKSLSLSSSISSATVSPKKKTKIKKIKVKKDKLHVKKAKADNKKDNVDVKKDKTDIKKEKVDTKKDKSDIKKDKINIKRDKTDAKKDKTDIKKDKTDIKREKTDIKKEKTDIKKEKIDSKKDKLNSKKDKANIKKDKSNSKKAKPDSKLDKLDTPNKQDNKKDKPSKQLDKEKGKNPKKTKKKDDKVNKEDKKVKIKQEIDVEPPIPKLRLVMGSSQSTKQSSKTIPKLFIKPTSPTSLSSQEESDQPVVVKPEIISSPEPVKQPQLHLNLDSPLSSVQLSPVEQRGVFIETIATTHLQTPTDQQVWYCPACTRPDDGSPMIGCDSCDGWYHWPCVGLTIAPQDDVMWYCPTCLSKQTKKTKKKRKKKDV